MNTQKASHGFYQMLCHEENKGHHRKLRYHRKEESQFHYEVDKKFNEGLTTELQNPSGKLYIDRKLLVFGGNRNVHYHEEINTQVNHFQVFQFK